MIINIGRIYRPLWDDTVAEGVLRSRISISACHAHSLLLSRAGARGHSVMLLSMSAAWQLESVAARFGMTPERVLQVNADLQGMHPGDLFSEFKRPVGLLPRHAPHVAAHVRASLCPSSRDACACMQRGARLLTASGLCGTQANNLPSQELCIVPDSCGIGSDVDYSL